MENKLKQKIKSLISESEQELKLNGTDYEAVLNCEDTEGYNENGENNNFSAGRISALKELLKDLE